MIGRAPLQVQAMICPQPYPSGQHWRGTPEAFRMPQVSLRRDRDVGDSGLTDAEVYSGGTVYMQSCYQQLQSRRL